MTPLRWLKHFSRVLVPTLAWVIGTAATAQTVYRCGNAYTHVRCVEGSAVTATAAVSAGDPKDAERVLARERMLAREMEDDRRRQEAVKPMRAGSFTAALPTRPAASAPHKVAARKRKGTRGDIAIASAVDPAAFTARVPGTVKKR